jgi:predicted dehydrogenase
VQVRADEMTLLTIEFENGAVGSLSTSMVATGRKNQLAFEINGSKGSISFDLEQLNVLEVYIGRDGEPELQGFTRINVSDKSHPLMKDWWPPAHILGWEHGHINEMKHFLECVAKGKSVDPIGATFLDGAKAVEIAERAFQASKDGKRYRIGEPYARRSGTK